jgi:hypothetical protein
LSKTTIRVVFGLLALTYMLTHFLGHAHAQALLSISTDERRSLHRPVCGVAQLDQYPATASIAR